MFAAIFFFAVIGGPVGFIYSVVQLSRRHGTPGFSWRDRVSTAALILIAVSLALWPLMFVLFRGSSPPEVESPGLRMFESSAAWMALAAIPVSCVGRLRLILPNAAAAIAAVFWWVSTTIP